MPDDGNGTVAAFWRGVAASAVAALVACASAVIYHEVRLSTIEERIESVRVMLIRLDERLERLENR